MISPAQEPHRHGLDVCGYDPFDEDDPQTFECQCCGVEVCWCSGCSDNDEFLAECCDECWSLITCNGEFDMTWVVPGFGEPYDDRDLPPHLRPFGPPS